jgi:DNA-binding transcriptional LysR family regulator
MLHTRDLRYFVAVADHLHITRAAASLYVTQPALSKQIASLERTLDVQLFVRRPDGVVLTPAGEALLPRARQMLDLEREAVAEVHHAATHAEKLTIGFWIAPENEPLARAIAKFSADHPRLRLRLRRADWTERGAGVESGQADVGLVWTPHDAPMRRLRHHLLAVEDVVLAMRRDHPLAGREFVGPEDLANETVFGVLLTEQTTNRRKGREDGFGHGSPRENVTTIDETLEAIANGLGVCPFTPSVATTHRHDAVVTVPFHGAPPGDYSVVWRQEAEGRPEVRALVRALVSAWEERPTTSWKAPADAALAGSGDH